MKNAPKEKRIRPSKAQFSDLEAKLAAAIGFRFAAEQQLTIERDRRIKLIVAIGFLEQSIRQNNLFNNAIHRAAIDAEDSLAVTCSNRAWYRSANLIRKLRMDHEDKGPAPRPEERA